MFRIKQRGSAVADVLRYAGLAVLAIVLLAAFVTAMCSFKTVDPGNRGVKVTLGKVSPSFVGEGLTWKMPYLTSIYTVSVRQDTRETQAACFSSDLQQINMKLKVLYRLPESSVVKLYQEYNQGDAFDSLVAPRVQEAIKEATAGSTAEDIVKKRETIKQSALLATNQKIAGLIVVDDLVIENIDLSKDLEQAIEAKMVQQQETQKAHYVKEKAIKDAETMKVTAAAEADAIRVRGQALKETPDLIALKIVEKWDGKSPLYVGGGASGASMILPVK